MQVMAPMTRNRAVKGNAPDADTEAVYYAQRASAGLLVTEGTSPSADGIGYARMPGVYSDAQVAGWKAVADAVSAGAGTAGVRGCCAALRNGCFREAVVLAVSSLVISPLYSLRPSPAFSLQVHAKGGRIFMQLMHCGRIGAAPNMVPGARLLAPSPITAAGTIYTDSAGMQPHGAPAEMSAADVAAAVRDFATAARNAVERAGFDGVEVHGANG